MARILSQHKKPGREAWNQSILPLRPQEGISPPDTFILDPGLWTMRRLFKLPRLQDFAIAILENYNKATRSKTES